MAETDRAARRRRDGDRFLDDAGWAEADRRLLAGDASNRRYDRLRHQTLGRAVLMDADPALGEDVVAFAALTATLRARGLSAPEIYAMDAEAGFLLLEDLGDDLYAREIAERPQREDELYAAAIDLLVKLRDDGPIAIAAADDLAYPIADYDQAALQREADLAVAWWRPAALGPDGGDDPTTSAEIAASFRATIAEACADAAAERSVLVLRDYHAENLIWLPQRPGLARVGLLDYQDALVGHPAYDLASLLEDARRDVPEDLAQAMIDRFAAGAGLTDRAAFRAAYAALAAQRNLKIIGIFTRLWRRDGKDRYLANIPRVWRHLRRDLAHPALAPLREWTDRHLPAPTDEVLARVRAADPIGPSEEGAV